MQTSSNITGQEISEELNHQILKERARILAQKTDVEKADELEVLIFTLSDENYAFETFEVKEVVKVYEITPLPSTPDFLKGIVNVRGEILSVIDIRLFFNLENAFLNKSFDVIIIQCGNKVLGILADKINGVSNIPKINMQSSLPTLNVERHKYLKGISNKRVVILDAKNILNDKNLIIDNEI